MSHDNLHVIFNCLPQWVGRFQVCPCILVELVQLSYSEKRGLLLHRHPPEFDDGRLLIAINNRPVIRSNNCLVICLNHIGNKYMVQERSVDQESVKCICASDRLIDEVFSIVLSTTSFSEIMLRSPPSIRSSL